MSNFKIPRKSQEIDKAKKAAAIIEAAYEHGGIVKKVAAAVGMSRQNVYLYIDEFIEVAEAFEKADAQLDREVVETCYEKLDEFIGMSEDNSVSMKAIDLALKRSKKSRYYIESKKSSDIVVDSVPAAIADVSRQLADAQAEIARLRAEKE